MSKSSKHLSLNDRISILQFVTENKSMRKIGRTLGYSASTISRELSHHRYLSEAKSFNRKRDSNSCHSSRLASAPWVCHGCNRYGHCQKDKYLYTPKFADQDYRSTLIVSRHKVGCGSDAFDYLNDLLLPLIKDKGQSFNHVFASISNQLGISKSTLYRYIDKGYLNDIKNIDLPRRVRYKPHRSSKSTVTKDTTIRIHRTYLDFLTFIKNNKCKYICEIDSVIGSKGEDEKVLLTLLFRNSNFMLAFLRNHNDAQSVVDIFDRLESLLGFAKFASLFHVVLGDNGSEFAYVDALEANHRKLQRCNFFYCDARASQQKGKLEKNHEFIRYYLPQGTSFNHLSQCDVDIMMNHINSTKRSSLNDKSPFECLTKSQITAIKKLGYTEIAPQQVISNPSLFRK
ncbi:IS30 family transposase [Anaerorhabdus furcosa]|uniref:Transposase and inactivated derivatives, IS30 family n=1 Tax=Anaerorhabdus furcosa TaxID=118967 RepID=A0A1T4KMC1_9FIRM|nr:IS30 family transposase [Anaerorhabdus furcosa]SJZ43540.1 Transposase and inactivated derivatives, IS30 family [Anaerorhabdus furcosa]